MGHFVGVDHRVVLQERLHSLLVLYQILRGLLCQGWICEVRVRPARRHKSGADSEDQVVPQMYKGIMRKMVYD